MNRGQIVIEKPAIPDRPVVVRLLSEVMVPHSEIVRQIEELFLVIRHQHCLGKWAKILQNVNQVPYCIPTVIQAAPCPTKFVNGGLDPGVHICGVVSWHLRLQKGVKTGCR